MSRPFEKGHTPVSKGRGKGIAWLREHVFYDGSGCLLWPYSKCQGYGTLGYLGDIHYAHRLMCELVHGPAPTDKHEAAHECGNGKSGCCHPKHLFWKTRTENAEDRVAHGRAKPRGGAKCKITQAIADEIRALKGSESQYKIAERYGVSRETVAQIHRGIAWTGKPHNWRMVLSADDRARIAGQAKRMHADGKSYTEIGREFNITRAYASCLARGVYK